MDLAFNAEELAFQKAMATRKTLPLDPPHPFTAEEREQATLWETPLKDFVTQSGLQFILGQRSFADWDAYLAELKAKKSDEYIALVNKAYERFQKENS